MTAAGVATWVVVGVMVMASVTLLPAFLGLAGERLSRSRLRRRPAGEMGQGWKRWGEHVSATPGHMRFQWGWGTELIGLETTVPIISFLPMFMFAVLFGLSMDYEVFLLSRVREEYLATGDNEASVIRGISSTARVITSAALIMISVFLGFVLGDDPVIKMMGLGLAPRSSSTPPWCAWCWSQRR